MILWFCTGKGVEYPVLTAACCEIRACPRKMTVPELKQLHQILRTRKHQGLVLTGITVLEGKLFLQCVPQAEQDPWENINTTGIPQAQCLLIAPTSPARPRTTLPWASNQHGHKIPQWVRLEETTLESPGPMSLLGQSHLRPHGTGLCPDSSGIYPVRETPHPSWADRQCCPSGVHGNRLDNPSGCELPAHWCRAALCHYIWHICFMSNAH